jgi:hypothetical protein
VKILGIPATGGPLEQRPRLSLVVAQFFGERLSFRQESIGLRHTPDGMRLDGYKRLKENQLVALVVNGLSRQARKRTFDALAGFVHQRKRPP